MANMIPISAPFLSISCLCARASHFWQQIILILITSVLYTAQWQLMTMGMTFDNGRWIKYNSLSSGGSFSYKIGQKYF